MKTAISIPDDLYRAAERAASQLHVSRSELYRRALRAFLERHEGGLATDALNQVYDGDPSQSEVDPVLSSMQGASLPREDW